MEWRLEAVRRLSVRLRRCSAASRSWFSYEKTGPISFEGEAARNSEGRGAFITCTAAANRLQKE